MLKLVFPLVFSKSWSSVQLGLLTLSFMFSINCYHNLFMYELGFMFGMYYISYIMIYLSLWIMSLIILASQKVQDLL